MVLFPINVYNYHWCLGVVELLNWNILIFDSLRDLEHDKKVLECVGLVSAMLWDVVNSTRFFFQKIREATDKKGKRMQMCRLKSPAQSGGYVHLSIIHVTLPICLKLSSLLILSFPCAGVTVECSLQIY